MALPHIVLLLADALGWNMTGWQGNPDAVTPAMDELVSREGLVLRRHYTQSFSTPSRAALLTGRPAFRAGLPADECSMTVLGPLRALTLLPHKLQAAGFATHLLGSWDAGMLFEEALPGARGFDSSLGPLFRAHDPLGRGLPTDDACRGAAGLPITTVDLWDTDRPAVDPQARPPAPLPPISLAGHPAARTCSAAAQFLCGQQCSPLHICWGAGGQVERRDLW